MPNRLPSIPSRPVRVVDGQVVTPQPSAPSMGGSNDGSNVSTPSARPSGYSTNVPQPDNKGPRSSGGDQGLGTM